jgi:large subunit ribosomal protein L18
MCAKYIPVFRRRREGKTDYGKRAKALVGRLPLLSVRTSNRYVLAQLIKPTLGGDTTLVAVHSKRLLKYGWPFSLKSTPACYLVGYLLGKLALRKGVERAILYMGVKPFTRGGRVAAVMAGALEAGLRVSTSPEVLPEKERLRGEHIAAYAKALKSKDGELYQRRFSGLLRAGVDPTKYPEYVESVLEAIRRE